VRYRLKRKGTSELTSLSSANCLYQKIGAGCEQDDRRRHLLIDYQWNTPWNDSRYSMLLPQNTIDASTAMSLRTAIRRV